jgi:hypothetical protein
MRVVAGSNGGYVCVATAMVIGQPTTYEIDHEASLYLERRRSGWKLMFGEQERRW